MQLSGDIWSRIVELGTTRPDIALPFYFCSAILFLTAVMSSASRRFDVAFWSVFAQLVISVSWSDLSATHDGGHHLFRIVALADQLQTGRLSLLIQNDITHETLPVFLYYSIAPYLPGALLAQAGVTTAIALKLSLIFFLAVFAFGFRRLVRVLKPEFAPNAYAFATLVLASNYIAGDWIVRAAFAELSVYALTPWIIAETCTARIRLGRLGFLLALQMLLHPILVLQTNAAQVMPALLLSRVGPKRMLLSYFQAGCIGVVASAVYWLPALLAQDDILAVNGLQVTFRDSFLFIGELVDPTHFKTVGPWLLVACAAASLYAALERRWNVVIYAAGTWALLALQMHYFADVTTQIPVLEDSALVWRMMFSLAFSTFGLLCAVVKSRNSALPAFVTIAVTSCFLFCLSVTVGGMQAPWSGDSPARIRKDYSVPERIWGGLEFFPDYALLSDKCVERQGATQIDYGSARKGAIVGPGFAVIKAAPTGYVSWMSQGAPLVPAGKCGFELVLGPFDQPVRIQPDEHLLDLILALRLLALAGFGIVAVIWAFNFRKARSELKILTTESCAAEPRGAV